MKTPPKSEADICEYSIGDNGITVPLLVDLPHGGTVYPADFNYSCPFTTLELCEERHLDSFFTNSVRAAGGVVVKANFPRTYVDANRAVNDIDQLLFDTPWMEPVAVKGRSGQGHGVVMRVIRAGEPIYNHPLTHNDVRQRLEKFYRPYHEMLGYFSNDLHERFGVVYHLDCHSMPAHVVANSFPHLQPDVILGDLDGRACGLEFRQVVADTLKDMGYRVAINQLYKGAEIIHRYGQPAWGRHSLQMEINRALFQDDATFQKSKNFENISRDIGKLIEVISVQISR